MFSDRFRPFYLKTITFKESLIGWDLVRRKVKQKIANYYLDADKREMQPSSKLVQFTIFILLLAHPTDFMWLGNLVVVPFQSFPLHNIPSHDFLTVPQEKDNPHCSNLFHYLYYWWKQNFHISSLSNFCLLYFEIVTLLVPFVNMQECTQQLHIYRFFIVEAWTMGPVSRDQIMTALLSQSRSELFKEMRKYWQKH